MGMSSRRTVRRMILLLIAAALAVYGFVRLDNWYTRSQAEKEREAQVQEVESAEGGAVGESGSNGAGPTTEGVGQPSGGPEPSGTP